MNNSNNPCAIPMVAKDEGDGRWMSQHKYFLEQTKERKPDVLLIGDSIMQQLSLRPIWHDLFVPLNCLNFGIGGDITQNVLWRINNGEFDNISPKVVVILVGTNNTAKQDQPEDIADALLEIVKTIQTRLTDTYVVIVELLPRGEYPNVLRETNDAVNDLLRKKVSGIEKLVTINLSKELIDENGRISPDDMPDFLHLSETGYRKSFTPLYELITELLKNEHQV